ncbi:MAG: hypothetical protein Satyrvirus7_7 [Satyrvirus sp.]|uniref:NRDE family protein n=1 Tax=Satyrvirus sp. TaxID=2487771 RepID=A0A3G5AH65_9VIRU|nr:MAG: hypothetical protein Satyrvirus7_7 [Satyrvirus sp.]
MCIVFFAFGNFHGRKLFIAHNRVEFERPTDKLHLWDGGIIAGKDKIKGGTWLGYNTFNNNFAFLTNVGDTKPFDMQSRGKIVREILTAQNPKKYMEEIIKNKNSYNDFNLVFGNMESVIKTGGGVFFYNSKEEILKELSPNILYGLSNNSLDTPTPNILHGKNKINNLCENFKNNEIFKIMADNKIFVNKNSLKTRSTTMINIVEPYCGTFKLDITEKTYESANPFDVSLSTYLIL